MTKFHTSVFINAPREKVWEVMLGEDTYRQWAAAFHPGSFYRGSWEQGSKIEFIGPDPETGKEGGMSSRVVENRKPEFISVQHVAIVADGVEDSTSDAAKQWVPSFENYTFTEKDGGTELSIDVDLQEEYLPMFSKMWADALKLLKDIAER